MKMIRIRSIRVLDSEYNVISIHYPDDLRFRDHDHVEKFRNHEVNKWAEIYDERIIVDIDHVEIPKGLNVKTICKLTCEEMKITLPGFFGKTKNREVTKARMFAVNIMLDNMIPPALIEAQTPFKNRIYWYYQNRLNDLRETEPETDVLYKDVFDKVVKKAVES